MDAEYESAETDKCGEEQSSRDQQTLGPSVVSDREGEREPGGEAEGCRVRRVTGWKGGERDRGGMHRDGRAIALEDRLGHR